MKLCYVSMSSRNFIFPRQNDSHLCLPVIVLTWSSPVCVLQTVQCQMHKQTLDKKRNNSGNRDSLLRVLFPGAFVQVPSCEPLALVSYFLDLADA